MKLVASLFAFAIVCAAFLASTISAAIVELEEQSVESYAHVDRVRQLIGDTYGCFDHTQLPSGRLVVLDASNYCLGAIGHILTALGNAHLAAPELVQSDALRDSELVKVLVGNQPKGQQGLLAVLPILSAPCHLTFLLMQITTEFANQLSDLLDAHDQQLRTVAFLRCHWPADGLHLLESLSRQQRLREISVWFSVLHDSIANGVAFLQTLRNVLVSRESAWSVQSLHFASVRAQHQLALTELLAAVNEQRVPHLRHLSITWTVWSDGLRQQVILLLPHLQSLDVSGGDLDREQLWEILRAVPDAQDPEHQFSVLRMAYNPGAEQPDDEFMQELVALSARIDDVVVRPPIDSQIPAIAQARRDRWLAACPNGELEAVTPSSKYHPCELIALTPRTPGCMNMFGRLYDNGGTTSYRFVPLSAAERERAETRAMLEANSGLTHCGRRFLCRLLTAVEAF